MSQHNGDQNPTEINLDIATLDSSSGEENEAHSQSSRLIPDYANILTSGIRQIKIIQERRKRSGIPKIFVLTALFASVDVTTTNSILPETASFHPS